MRTKLEVVFNSQFHYIGDLCAACNCRVRYRNGNECVRCTRKRNARTRAPKAHAHKLQAYAKRKAAAQ